MRFESINRDTQGIADLISGHFGGFYYSAQTRRFFGARIIAATIVEDENNGGRYTPVGVYSYASKQPPHSPREYEVVWHDANGVTRVFESTNRRKALATYEALTRSWRQPTVSV